MTKTGDANLVWQVPGVSRADREGQHRQRGAVVWITGLSGAGKSTLAFDIERQLHLEGCRTYTLDGDKLRQRICADLGFSAADRSENVRRAAEIARLFLDAGVITLVALISPLAADRAAARAIVGGEDFIEVFCDCPLEVCEARDVKGLYRRARRGEIDDFTGISAPYEAPAQPEIVVNTARHDLAHCARTVLDGLKARGIGRLA